MNDLDAAMIDEEDFDADTKRNFEGLDARESQEALADELNEQSGTDSVTDDDNNNEDKAVEADAPTVEWSEEDIAAHTRMAEALLFAAAEPLDAKSLADRLPVGADIKTITERIAADYAERGVTLQKIDGKWRFVTAADVAHVLEKEKITPRRLSRAALETLAIIAYHQPCTRADIEDVRGVQVAKGSLDQLLEIGWVKLRGKRRDVPGRPTLYGTTDDFLQQFGLESIQDLPGLADLKAAGLLDARLPPGFSVPNPSGGDDEDMDGEEGEEAEFAQDFMASDDADDAEVDKDVADV
ncbi:MAG: SMC-Scp complex subunit ScpB [Pseudomonadota bacterium]